ncbi:amino acid adenylation domain-containing protein [Paenibacillus sp. FSL H8-0048]|uniref:amino acid adenylation domain-containing protein n=1 Tax=Paenibacillus sp. FSL H8-0048 TaxID=2954508 RepID=UPI0030FBF280
MINKLFDLTASKASDDEIVIQEVELPDRDIAIIGISCEIAEAENWKCFWDALIHGKDLVGDFPSVRDEDIQSLYLQQGMDEARPKYCKGAFIPEIDKFDHEFFRISPREAELMDPKQRIFLETAWKSLEDAGYGGDKLKGSRTGVFVGSSSADEYKRLIEVGAPSQYNASTVGNIRSIIASRIAYLLDFRGPSMIVDTACSSSLVAVHIACQSLRNDECEYALAGSVNIALLPVKAEQNEGLEIISKDGLTRTFDNSSDGTGLGEGVAAILLKPAVKAIEDGDYIYAVIKGSAINQDGNSNGITAPSTAAQEDVILRALKDARVHPETLSFIEAHGTGTPLGDPVEVDGIIKAFSKYTARKQFCAIGSVKSNVGHLDSAAGITGLIKAALSVNHKILPPSIHFERPNRNIRFQESPVFVNTDLLRFEEDALIRCGVSSFGLSGTNSHIILESYKNRVSSHVNSGNEIFTLSAKNVNSLKQLVRSFANYINVNQCASIEDICYTVNTGRGHYTNRLALIVTGINDLSAQLELLSGLDDLWLCNDMGMFYQTSADSQAEKGKNSWITYTENRLKEYLSPNLSQYEKENILKLLCKDYIAGADIAWEKLYRQHRYKIAGLPVYPFARERSWFKLEQPIHVTRNQRSIGTDSTSFAANVAANVRLLGRDSGLYSDMERLVASAWANVLGYQEIDINRDLYTAGGDSIHAARIANFLEEPIGRKIEVSDVLRYPTVAEFSMISGQPEISAVAKSDILPAEKKDVYPLSAAQKRLLLLYKLDEESLAYNLPVSLVIEGSLDSERLNRAIVKVIDNHEVFRTTFEMQEGKWVQRIHENFDFRLQYVADPVQDIEKIISDFIMPFNLEKGPLFRAMVIKREDSKHIFVMDCHHIVSDGTTMGILAQEIIDGYIGAPVNKPELQYKDYAEWHNRRLESEDISRQRKYWLDIFGDGNLPQLLLPLDKNRPEIQTYKGSRLNCRINQELAEGLKDLSLQTGSTLYMVMLAAYNVLLYKYTNQQDIIIGSPVTGRSHVKLENMMGVFINSLPMRNYPSGDKKFIDFLLEVKENVMKAYSNQECQFEDLVDRLALKRDLSRSPLFDTMFIMQNMKKQPIGITDLKISEFEMEHKFSKYDLTLEAMEEAGVISMSLEYATDLFSRDFIEKMAGHYIHIIREIVAASSIQIADIDMLGAKEKELLLSHSAGHTGKYKPGLTLNSGFEQQVQLHADQIALVSEEGSLTYQELNHYANRIAGLLLSEQVGPNEPVLVLMNKSIHAIASILGILKAGGAYVPLDPAYPLQRLAYMTKHSGSKFIITEHEHLEEALTLSMNDKLAILNVTGSEPASPTDRMYSRADLADHSPDNHPQSNHYADLMYIMYTSGSTGQPKGVMVTHSNVDNFITWATVHNRITRTDKMMLVSSISFDISVFEIFGALLNGAELHLMSPKLLRDSRAFIDYLEDKGITIWHSVPSLMNQMLAAFKSGPSINAKLEKVRKVMLGGEVWSTEMAKEIAVCFKKAEILNMYGPTEATIWISSYTIPRDKLDTMNKIPIGRPVNNNQILILDQDMNLCAAGIPGEIYMCGANITNGYYKAEDQSRQAFLTGKADSLMYKSCDVGKYLPDGNIEYLGRKDGMVKIRGYRVETGEIENALMKHPAVDAVSAIADERNNSTELLCFYVARVQLTVNEIKAFLEESLPDYMIPARFIAIESMPLLPNGKIEKKRLLELDLSQRPAMSSEYTSPTSSTEKYLVNLWSELLDMNEIGIHDNFFDLGGNSLILTTMQSILHERYPDHIKIVDLFKYPSVFKLAKHLERIAGQQEEKTDIADVNMDDEIMKWLELGAAEDISTDDIVQGILNMEVKRGRDY